MERPRSNRFSAAYPIDAVTRMIEASLRADPMTFGIAVSDPSRVETSRSLESLPVNSWPLRLAFVIRLIAPAAVIAWSGPIAAKAQSPGPAMAVLYSASDFPALANGVDPGFSGEAFAFVWAPSRDEWSLTPVGEAITFKLKGKPGDPTPRWQPLSKVKLAKGKPLKIILSEDSSGSTPVAKAETKARRKSQGSERKKRPVPALLWLSSSGTAPDLDLVRGRVDTAEPSPDRRRAEVRTNYQGADFQAPASAAAWRDRAVHLREQMLITLGLWPMFPKAPMRPQVYGKLTRDGYTIEKVVLETFPGFTLSGNLYRPIGATGKVPGILCPHGHWEDGRVNPEVQQRCIRWAKLGCVVFLYDMVGYNDSKPFPHVFLNDHLRSWGLSLPTLQTWNSIRALDWLTALPDVNVTRIGCTGESGGGTQTFLLTALDDRIKVAAPVVMVSDTFQGGCVCENAAGLRLGTDNVEFAAMCAPRPLILVGATGDWTKLTMERAYPAIRGVYALVGSTDRVSAQVFDFPHNYNQTTRNAVYAGMGRRLLGIDDPESTREGTQKPEKPEDLFTFDSGHPAPTNRKSPAQLEFYLVGTQARLIDDLAPSTGPSRWEASRRLLLTSMKVRTGVVNPTPEELNSRELRRVPREEFTVVHSLLGRASNRRGDPGRATDPRASIGSAHGDRASARQGGACDRLGRAGRIGEGAAGPRPRGCRLRPAVRRRVARPPRAGAAPARGGPFRDVQPRPGRRADAGPRHRARLVSRQDEVREVSLVAQGTSGYQALVARPMLEGLARTVIELAPWPLGSGDEPAVPATIDLPGLNQFGGLKAAAALSAPAPLWLHGDLKAIDASWPRAAYRLAGTPSMIRMESDEPGPDAIARWIDRGE